MQTFTSEIIDAARPTRHTTGDRSFVDETDQAVDQHGRVIDIYLSERRDGPTARALFTRALTFGAVPVEVTTDRAPAYPRFVDDLAPQARHVVDRYAFSAIGCMRAYSN